MYDTPSTIIPAQPVAADAILAEREIRRAAACRAFWSDHPLNLAFRNTGRAVFSLKDFIEFVVAMPSADFAACMFWADNVG